MKTTEEQRERLSTKAVEMRKRMLDKGCSPLPWYVVEETLHDMQKTPYFQQLPILDVDNGIDFTFDGLGLKGNR